MTPAGVRSHCRRSGRRRSPPMHCLSTTFSPGLAPPDRPAHVERGDGVADLLPAPGHPLGVIPVGHGSGIAIGFVLGLASVPFVHRLTAERACPWYAGLFALGMAAAIGRQWWPHSPRWLVAVAFPLCLLLADDHGVFRRLRGSRHRRIPRPHGRRAGAGLGSKTTRIPPRRSTRGVQLQPLLTHYPLQAWASATLVGLGLSPAVRLLVMMGPVTLLCLVVAYGFHLIAERPFMPGTRPQPGEGRGRGSGVTAH